MSTFSYNTGIQHLLKLFYSSAYCTELDCHFQHSLSSAISSILDGACDRPLTFPHRGFNSGEFEGHIILVTKSRHLFRSHFCMRFSGLGFRTKVFEHATITR